MANITTLEKISLKNHPEIKEDTIQKYIFDHPEILGIGELQPIKREKIQPSGGRLDILLSDATDMRYEVEIQLGATDPSHIIRTIEYWDLERKRYPQYNHCAVIVAEEITGRFMNVISLFNGSIPLIALQMSAFKTGDDISLVFTKVLDRIEYAADTDEEEEIKDRGYWEKRSTPKMMKVVDKIHSRVQDIAPDYQLKYNKFYVGVTKDGVTKNFVYYRPKKSFMDLVIKGEFLQEKIDAVENAGLEVNYDAKWRIYNIRLNEYSDFEKNETLFIDLIKSAMEYFNI